ncbi:MAG TPA: IS5 family transposase [Planctomycetota bacterium]|nr:IS5 family transposase [Planctomycetota bacterium]
MRGNETPSGSLFSYVNLESRIPATHPLRPIKVMVDAALKALDKDFDRMYSIEGRPGIPPERLLRALLLQVLYSVRSERQLMEQLDYNLLFRWFVGLGVDDPVWVPETFTQNRDRLQESQIAAKFFDQILKQAREAGLISKEHFTVDGTFIEAWASHKSFQRKDGKGDPPGPGRNAEADFKGEKRSNQTHESKTDPDARLMCKGREGAKLVHHGHVLTENRHGLVVATEVTAATGTCETEAASLLLERRGSTGPGTVGGDKGYDRGEFVESVRALGMTPHVAQCITTRRGSMIDGRTTRPEGYAISQRRRKMVEEPFGWAKTIGGLRKTRHRGTRLVDWIFRFTMAAYNLVRMRNLMAVQG